MISADSNLVIRHLVQDAPVQVRKVHQLFDNAELRQEPVLLSHIVLCEACWVFEAVYGFDKPQIGMALQALMDDAGFHIQGRQLVEEALKYYRKHSGQFSDHLIGVVARHEGARTTYTFDRAVGKLPNFTLMQ